MSLRVFLTTLLGFLHFLLINAQDCDSLLSTALNPKFPPSYYQEQGIKYFQTMQSDIPASVKPNYSDYVIRWEWPPWLLLTGFKKRNLINTDILLKLYPTAYDVLDCRFFKTQPFCRCHVVFDYCGSPCPIYEEFTFNDAGEITFIEAWSDYESLLPMTAGEDSIWTEQEYWGEASVYRLSTKIPGLGSKDGRINVNSDCMDIAIERDKDVADLIQRLKDPVNAWIKELFRNSKEVERGCEIPIGDKYPYYVPELVK